VARYHGYRHFWSTFRVPGEDNRDRLRWNLRVTLSQEDSPKRNKVYIDFVIGATSTPRSTSVHSSKTHASTSCLYPSHR
jgi:hypothetical protein